MISCVGTLTNSSFCVEHKPAVLAALPPPSASSCWRCSSDSEPLELGQRRAHEIDALDHGVELLLQRIQATDWRQRRGPARTRCLENVLGLAGCSLQLLQVGELLARRLDAGLDLVDRQAGDARSKAAAGGKVRPWLSSEAALACFWLSLPSAGPAL